MVLKSVFIEQRVAAHEAVLEESHDVIAILEACDIDGDGKITPEDRDRYIR